MKKYVLNVILIHNYLMENALLNIIAMNGILHIVTIVLNQEHVLNVIVDMKLINMDIVKRKKI